MPYKITVVEIVGAPSESEQTAVPVTVPPTEVYSQTLPDLDLPNFIRALNPVVAVKRPRKRKDSGA